MEAHRILTGEAVEQLRTLADGSVQCCVTSPPYWGLRDYGVDGQIGMERTPEAYVARLVAVFREVRRVLRDDGTLWLNIGDTYASAWACSRRNQVGNGSMENGKRDNRPDRLTGALKEKDLVGIPWRVAFALQADGWWLRSEIVWAKKAPMPESVRDRPTRSHEKVFLLTKAARYFYDAEAVRETSTGQTGAAADFRRATKEQLIPNQSAVQHRLERQPTTDRGRRNQRDVWYLGPEPYPEAHFATFPTEIPRRAILAGTSARGCCPVCGAPWKRVIEGSGTGPQRKQRKNTQVRLTKFAGSAWQKWKAENPDQFKGWEPTCDCDAGEPVACTALDPFLGSGTTLAVAKELGRWGVGVELNGDYVDLAWKRINAVQAPLPLAL